MRNKKLIGGFAAFTLCAACLATGVAMNAATEAEAALPSFDVLGGSVRTESPTGLRFAVGISEAYATADAEIGTLVIPTEILGENTLNHNDDKSDSVNDLAYREIVCSKTWATVLSPKDGYKYFYAVLAEIPEENYATKISAVSYVKVDGTYYYSDVCSRSVAEIASKAIAENETDENGVLANYVNKAFGESTFMVNGKTIAAKGGEIQLSVSNNLDCVPVWSTSAASVATVDQTGKVTAVGGGNAVITATIAGKTVEHSVEVVEEKTGRKELVGKSADLSAAASFLKANATYTYTIKKDGAVVGEANQTLTESSVAFDDYGTYTVEYTRVEGEDSYREGTLTLDLVSALVVNSASTSTAGENIKLDKENNDNVSGKWFNVYSVSLPSAVSADGEVVNETDVTLRLKTNGTNNGNAGIFLKIKKSGCTFEFYGSAVANGSVPAYRTFSMPLSADMIKAIATEEGLHIYALHEAGSLEIAYYLGYGSTLTETGRYSYCINGDGNGMLVKGYEGNFGSCGEGNNKLTIQTVAFAETFEAAAEEILGADKDFTVTKGGLMNYQFMNGITEKWSGDYYFHEGIEKDMVIRYNVSIPDFTLPTTADMTNVMYFCMYAGATNTPNWGTVDGKHSGFMIRANQDGVVLYGWAPDAWVNRTVSLTEAQVNMLKSEGGIELAVRYDGTEYFIYAETAEGELSLLMSTVARGKYILRNDVNFYDIAKNGNCKVSGGVYSYSGMKFEDAVSFVSCGAITKINNVMTYALGGNDKTVYNNQSDQEIEKAYSNRPTKGYVARYNVQSSTLAATHGTESNKNIFYFNTWTNTTGNAWSSSDTNYGVMLRTNGSGLELYGWSVSHTWTNRTVTFTQVQLDLLASENGIDIVFTHDGTTFAVWLETAEGVLEKVMWADAAGRYIVAHKTTVYGCNAERYFGIEAYVGAGCDAAKESIEAVFPNGYTVIEEN